MSCFYLIFFRIGKIRFVCKRSLFIAANTIKVNNHFAIQNKEENNES